MADRIAIDLDCVQLRQSCQQRQRDCAEPGTDLDQSLLGARIDRADDAGDHARIVQEVLAEAFARNVHQAAADASCSAMSMAVTRLPESALPVPASESAVPWS